MGITRTRWNSSEANVSSSPGNSRTQRVESMACPRTAPGRATSVPSATSSAAAATTVVRATELLPFTYGTAVSQSFG